MVDYRGAVELSREAHLRADTDSGPLALHHTLGKLPNQAARGDHKHSDLEIGGWQTYSPTWKASDGTVLTVGNGDLSGQYRQIGDIVHFCWAFTIGSTTSGLGKNDWVFGYPTAIDTTGPCHYIQGSGFAVDVSTSWRYVCVPNQANTEGCYLLFPIYSTSTAASVFVLGSAFAPTTFASGDQILLSGSYRAAT